MRGRRNPEARMSLAEHLRELRKRIIIATIAILVGMVLGWFLSEPIWYLMRQPIELIDASNSNAVLNYPNITGAFDLKMQLAFASGLVVSSPVWLYQIWAFIVPGLKQKERRYSIGFILSAAPLFVAGCAVGWLVFPNIVTLLTSFAPADDATILTARDYLDFVLKLMFAIGTAFVLPVFLVLLNFAGIMKSATLRKGWRVAVLIIVLFAGITTPAADIISMLLLAGAMSFLFFIALFITWIHDRRISKKQQNHLSDLLGES
ncbi:MAG: twin-arginine translocase subunit TatC [Microbacteriaceae bacterium]